MEQSPSSIRPEQTVNECLKRRLAKRAPTVFRAARLGALIVAAGVLAAASPLYAQRGGGGGGASGGGGGSHGGGGSVGGGWSGGGGGWSGGGGGHSSGGGSSSHSSGGGSHASSGGTRSNGGARGSSGGRRSGAWSGDRSLGNATHRGGFSAAIRRFFGLPVATPSGGNAAFSPGQLPPAISRVRFQGLAAEFDSRKPVGAIIAPPRPIVPHPRHVLPYPPYGYCYGCDIGLGFGLGFGLDFGLFDFGYTNWYPGIWRQQAASADMILYLNDGSALEAADYWVDGDTLHYVTDDGAERTIAVKDLDLQRTTEANQRLGLKFTLDRTERGTPFTKARE